MHHPNSILSAIAAMIIFSTISGCGSIPPTSQHTATRGIQLANQARTLINTPYQYGGNNLKGFDCSGLIQYTHQRVGINIPRTTQAQLKKSKPVKISRLQPGDLIFFRLTDRKASHVGIYIGDNQMIHAPSSGKRVAYASLDASGYWRQHIIASGRFY